MLDSVTRAGQAEKVIFEKTSEESGGLTADVGGVKHCTKEQRGPEAAVSLECARDNQDGGSVAMETTRDFSTVHNVGLYHRHLPLSLDRDRLDQHKHMLKQEDVQNEDQENLGEQRKIFSLNEERFAYSKDTPSRLFFFFFCNSLDSVKRLKTNTRRGFQLTFTNTWTFPRMPIYFLFLCINYLLEATDRIFSSAPLPHTA